MNATNNPTGAQRPIDPVARSTPNPYPAQPAQPAPPAQSAPPARPARAARPQTQRSHETKASYKTTELIVYLIAVIGVLLASYLVKTTDGHEDYFRADKAWFYVVLLSIGYMLSRGLAKSGSRHSDR